MKRLMLLWLHAVSVALLCSMVSCAGQIAQETDAAQRPVQLDDGWHVASPEDVGLNSHVVEQLSERIAQGGYGAIHSLLIVRDGRLVWEEYYRDFERGRLHEVQSVTKSITSALVGLAVAQGYLAGVELPVYRFFPEYGALFDADTLKKDITIEHLLTMTAGLAWNESDVPYTDPENDMRRLNESVDWLRFVLERPMAAEPGATFSYNGGCTMLLGAILKRATGMPAHEFAERHLFEPLGISTYEWTERPDGTDQTPHTAGGLSLRARDLTKVGYLYSNDGLWQGRQVLPERWIEASTRAWARSSGSLYYGYQWWVTSLQTPTGDTRAIRLVFASGYGGQYVFVLPDLELVVVVLGRNYGGEAAVSTLLTEYVLKAVGVP